MLKATNTAWAEALLAVLAAAALAFIVAERRRAVAAGEPVSAAPA